MLKHLFRRRVKPLYEEPALIKLHHLPYEIWAVIFKFCHEQNSLALVCQSWRQLALSTPTLWTRINLSIFTEVALEGCSKKLALSGTLPIDVAIYAPNLQDFDDLVDLLRPHVSRFRVFDVECQDNEIFIHDLAYDQPAPLLESLRITVLHKQAADIWPNLFNCFNPSPRLTHLELPPHYLPLTRLPETRLPSISSISLQNTLSREPTIHSHRSRLFLSSFPSLQTVVFNVSDSQTLTPSITVQLVTLPHITTLDLLASNCGINLFAHLSIPQLTRVTLRYGYTISNPKYLPAVLSARCPLLTHLTIIGLDAQLPAETWHWLLCDAFPALEVLELHGVNIHEDAFLFGACPSLKRLVLRKYNLPQEVVDRFRKKMGKDFELILGSSCY